MDTKTRPDQLREAHNPLFNDRKLKLGTFCSNLSYGCAISTIDGTLKAEWPSTLALAQMADQMQMEAIVPVGRWKGFGGTTNFNGAGFESSLSPPPSQRRRSIPAFSPRHMCRQFTPSWLPSKAPRSTTLAAAASVSMW